MPLHTALYYLTFVALFLTLVYSLYNDSYGKKIPYAGIVILLILFGGLRYMVGRDYPVYSIGYANTFNIALNHMEPFWQGLRHMMQFIGLPAEVWFMLTAAFIVIVSLRGYRKQSYSFAIALIVYVFIYALYFEGFNTVRQNCAQAVVLFTFPLFQRKQYWQTLILLLIAFMLHRTAIIMVVLLPLCFIRYSRWLVFVTLFLGCFVLPYFLRQAFEALIASNIIDNFYLDAKNLKETMDPLSPAFLVRFGIGCFFIYRQEAILRNDKSLLPYLNAYYFALFLSLTFMRVFNEGTMTRFAGYPIYFTPIFFANLFVVGDKIDRWALFVILLFEVFITITSIFISDTYFDRFYLYDTIFFDWESPMTYPGETSSIYVGATNNLPTLVQFIPQSYPLV